MPWEQVNVNCFLGSFTWTVGSCLVSGKGKMRSAHMTHFRSNEDEARRQIPSLTFASFFSLSTAVCFPSSYRCPAFVLFHVLLDQLPVLCLDKADLLYKPILVLYYFQNNFILSIPQQVYPNAQWGLGKKAVNQDVCLIQWQRSQISSDSFIQLLTGLKKAWSGSPESEYSCT